MELNLQKLLGYWITTLHNRESENREVNIVLCFSSKLHIGKVSFGGKHVLPVLRTWAMGGHESREMSVSRESMAMIYMNSQTNKTDIWPNFFIVGAARAGTTTLYEYLRRVPEIYLPSIKEPRYFLARSIYEDIYGRLAVGNTKNYLELFANSNATAIGEATPEYLYHDSAAHKIREKVPHAKIIITLRDPISRALSHYLLLKGLRKIEYSFDEMVKSEWANNKIDLGGS